MERFGAKKWTEEEIAQLSEEEVEERFWRDKQGNIYPYEKCDCCRVCNYHDPNTFLPILEGLDLPFLADEWDRLINTFDFKGSLLKRYISFVKLPAYKPYTYEDSHRFNFRAISELRERL